MNNNWRNVPAVWVTNLPDAPHMRLKVRSAAASGYFEEVERRTAMIPRDLVDRLGQIGLTKKLENISIEVAVQRLLVDWDRVVLNGEPLPFSPNVAREQMAKHRTLHALVVAAAAKVDDDRLPGYTAGGMA